MKKLLVCIETGKKTALSLTDAPWNNDDILDAAANRMLRREPEHRHDFVCIDAQKMRSEICHGLGNLTEHTGEYRTFRLIGEATE